MGADLLWSNFVEIFPLQISTVLKQEQGSFWGSKIFQKINTGQTYVCLDTVFPKTDIVEKSKLEQIPGGNLWQLRLAALLTGEGGGGWAAWGGNTFILRQLINTMYTLITKVKLNCEKCGGKFTGI